MLKVEVGIHLSRGDTGVAQHLLHRAQIARGLQHVRGERMAKHVRVYPCRQPLHQATPMQPQLDHAHAQTGTALADEERRFVGCRQPAALPSPERHRCPGLAPHGHEAQLATFAEDAHLAGLQILQTGKVERREFGEAQARRVEQLEHRLIAQLQQAFAFGFQQAAGFIGR